jgi:omega-6 fatty acid desaturase (delta-12 desaturase)
MRHPFTKLAAYQAPIQGRALWQLGSTLAAYAAALSAMYAAALHGAWWLALLLAVPAAGFVVRLFIIQHDCGHASFFHARWANTAIGWLCSLATFTPYTSWRRQHAQHHAVWNNLDRRDHGADIYSTCLTLREYQALPPVRRALYRLVRHPLVSQLLLPPLVFLLLYRVPFDMPRSWRKERLGVYLCNAALLAVFGTLVMLLGAGPVLLVHLPVMVVASIVGVWLFSVQHRFEEALWARQPNWDAVRASLGGSSYLRLPQPLQWFTGNIGFHHIHHLLPRVPNYRLQECHQADPALAAGVITLTLREALCAPTYALWDEERGRMVKFPAEAFFGP